MNEELTAEGYEQTREKLRNLERRLAEIEARSDLPPPVGRLSLGRTIR